MDQFSLTIPENKVAFKQGMRDGFPIGLGYFAVSFALGIAAKNSGLSPFQAFLTSLLVNASAGEYAGFSLIGLGASYLEMAIMILIANARYLLMSLALSQRMKEGTSIGHRLLVAFDVTDELFAIAIHRPGYINPNYTYAAVIIAAPFWAVGTALGCMVGNLMPLSLVSAFSVALFGMFLAVIIPPARKSKILIGIILLCFTASYFSESLPLLCTLSAGTRTIILTIVISALAAIIFPHREDDK